ncbi:hypothetical protein L484_001135 [Morus notabilis]|uniref:Uncharacterized protein n=1 Tax=Morus notabilis TaxID=981085 RepID=W9RN66_9ROSA|nr:hypothetical protein L484_001135 [Morus notabilis]
MFGGLAKSGHLRLRSGEAYTIDLEDEEPHWRPPPRLDHVAVSMPCGRIIIFGGSMYDYLDFSASTAILGRSRENHLEDADGDSPLQTLTRMGEAERWKKVVAEREENLELDEANAEEGEEGDEVY